MKAKQKIIISLILFSILILAFGIFIIYPIFNAILQDHNRVLSQKTELAKITTDIKNIESFKEISREHGEEFAKSETLLVNLDNLIPFVEFLEGIARSSQMSLDIAPSDPKKFPEDTWPSMDFKLSAKASYPNLLRLLEKLEYAPYLMEIKNVDIRNPNILAGQTQKSPQPLPGDTQFTILLRVYTK